MQRFRTDKPALAYEESFADKNGFAEGVNVETDVSAPREQWKTWTWGEYFETCKQLGRANLALGRNKSLSNVYFRILSSRKSGDCNLGI